MASAQVRVEKSVVAMDGIGAVARFADASGQVAQLVAEEKREMVAKDGRSGQIAQLVAEEKRGMVARDGIEPPTQGFSVLCSTN